MFNLELFGVPRGRGTEANSSPRFEVAVRVLIGWVWDLTVISQECPRVDRTSIWDVNGIGV